MTFPTSMTFILFRGLPNGSGEFQSFQQYNLGIGKGEGKVEGVEVKGMRSEWRYKPANSTSDYTFIFGARVLPLIFTGGGRPLCFGS